MESMIKLNEIDAAVTMHYTFPIGVSTVGRIITPSRGNEMFIATTAGTSSMERVPGMVQNAIYGIITAKACGIKNPTVGILNVEGARQVETALKKLKRGGYDIQFAQSKRSEGGIVMRGNDLLSGTCNVMVMDSFTGNLVVKIFSSFTTGGNYETIGYGYGPGISQDYDKLILIISRASGIPMVEGAVEFAAELVKGHCLSVAKEEFEKAKKAGLEELLKSLSTNEIDAEEVVIPKKEIVTSQISAIEITELEEAVKVLWKNGIYAEIGMGCTGGVILVKDINRDLALKILSKHQYLDNN
jgi:fatty acid/phospholipid biosynthesis enzyme